EMQELINPNMSEFEEVEYQSNVIIDIQPQVSLSSDTEIIPHPISEIESESYRRLGRRELNTFNIILQLKRLLSDSEIDKLVVYVGYLVKKSHLELIETKNLIKRYLLSDNRDGLISILNRPV